MSKAVLEAVLSYETPPSWEHRTADSYTNSYLLFDVERYSTEYQELIEDIDDDHIVYIKRIQNPFQLGLFKIQEEKRRNEGRSTTKTIGYHVINPQDLDSAVKYTIDFRRYQFKNSAAQYNCLEKHPKFYNEICQAYKIHDNLINDNEMVIIKCERFVTVENQADYHLLYAICLKIF